MEIGAYDDDDEAQRAYVERCGGNKEAIIEFTLDKLTYFRRESIIAVKTFKPSMLNKYRTPPSNLYQFLVCMYRAFRQMFAG